ncbi:4-amino-4-deoxy-L-arabinose transferase-like glycosyltransferase [Curtobacterium luteum]|uniref:4-amino-4-deoxy-L-arabinose transferase-like glycosyltransferase n=1 Tax=Curtobacterium luteum TaxID=33881 RepID=A0A8H9GDI1_9MICO|nr:glycosyltransferase family 39 protein [Curtobacterium luteum]MBM7802068.1 4-amino-4-deoxy-L-arabinose transferase-like glycosyltransferase [Curtobacterium luteum]GGL09191.1 hypothetical protein GCM10009769_29030 [Curtobacterium luteum]
MTDAGTPVRGVGRAERLVVLAVTIAFAAVLAVWAFGTTTFKAPDEPTHVDAVVHVAIGDGWAPPGTLPYLNATESAQHDNLRERSAQHPTWGALLDEYPGDHVGSVDQMTQHPPTYYVIAAGVLHLVHFEDLRWDHAVLPLRLFDALLALPLPFLAWATVRRLTRSPRAAVVGAAAVLAIPELAAIGASVTNDALMLPLAGLLVYLVTRLLTGDHRVRLLVGIAVALGAMLLVKGTALPAVPFVGIAVVTAGLHRGVVLRNVIRAFGTLALAALVGAWWWLHNLIVYRQIQPDGMASYARPDKPFPAGTGPSPEVFLRDYWNGVTRTFWGSVGSLAQFQVAQALIDALTVLSLAGIAVWAFRRGPSLRPAIVLAAYPVILIALHMQSGWGGYVRNTIVAGTQGRYYYPTLIALIALSALAWPRATVTARGRTRLAVGMAIAACAIALYGVLYVVRAFGADGAWWITRSNLTRYDVVGLVGGGWIATLVVLAGLLLAATAVLLVRWLRGTAPERRGTSPVTPERTSSAPHSEARA